MSKYVFNRSKHVFSDLLCLELEVFIYFFLIFKEPSKTPVKRAFWKIFSEKKIFGKHLEK